jgi:hypothetical protein
VVLYEATANRKRAWDCPEDLSFQSFTQHATLFLSRFNTEFEFSVFPSASGRALTRSAPQWLATISPRGPGGGAILVIEILSKLHRDVAQTGEPDGELRAAGRCTRTRAMRLGKKAPAAPFAGLAGRSAQWGKTAGNPGADDLRLLDAGDRLCVGRTAIDNKNGGASWAPRGVTIRLVVASGEYGGKGGD